LFLEPAKQYTVRYESKGTSATSKVLIVWRDAFNVV